MLQHLKIGVKLGLSFSLILIITSLIGMIGYLGFNQVEEYVEKADDANRILKEIEITRQKEKNFIIRKNDESKQAVRDQIQSITAEMKKSREKINHKEALESIDGVAKGLNNYQSAAELYFSLAEKKQASESQMVVQARDVMTIADDILKDQKLQLHDVQKKASEIEVDRLFKADTANRMIKLIQECRMSEKNYMLRQDPKYADEVRKTLQNLVNIIDDLTLKMTQKQNLDQMEKTKQSISEYVQTFERWVASGKEMVKESENMVLTARSFLKECETIRSEQKEKMNLELSKTMSDINAIKERIQNADSANRLIKLVQKIRLAEKNYMIRNDEKEITELNELIEEILSLTTSFGQRVKREEERTQIQSIKKLAQSYATAFKNWVQQREEQKIDEEKMIIFAREVEETCIRFRTEQKKQLAESQKLARQSEKDKLNKADDANLLIQFALECRRYEKNYIITKDQSNIKKCIEFANKILELGKGLAAKCTNEININKANSIVTNITEYLDTFKIFVESTNEQVASENKMVESARNVTTMAEKCRVIQKNQMQHKINTTTMQFGFGIAFAIVIGGLLAFFITRMITRPIIKAVHLSHAIGEGDMSQRLNLTAKDEIGQMAQALDQIPITIQNVLNEFDSMVQNIEFGRINNKGNHSQFKGAFSELIEGANRLVSVLISHINAIPTPTMIIDKDYNVLFLSKTGADIIGRSQKEVMGRKCYDLIETKDCRTSNCACSQAMSSGQKTLRETEARPGGNNMDISYTGVPLKNSEGEIVGALEVIMDITDAKQAFRISDKVNLYQINEVDKLSDVLDKISEGNMLARYSPAQADENTKSVYDNFNKIAKALNETFDQLADMIKSIKLNSETLVSSSSELTLVSTQLASGANQMTEQTNNVASATEEMSNNINTIASAAEEMSTNIVNVSSTAEQMSQNMNSVASAVEETTMSMNEIGKNADEGERIASKAAEMANNATSVMKTLGDAAKEIGAVTEVIKRIADQTNLLALNATI